MEERVLEEIVRVLEEKVGWERSCSEERVLEEKVGGNKSCKEKMLLHIKVRDKRSCKEERGVRGERR